MRCFRPLFSLARKPPAGDRRRPAGAEEQPDGSRETPRDDPGFIPAPKGAWFGEGSEGDKRTNYRFHRTGGNISETADARRSLVKNNREKLCHRYSI